MSPQLLGALRGLGIALVTTVIAFFADPSHLTFLSAGEGAIVSAVLLAIEHAIQAQTGKAGFGMIRVKRF